MNTNEHPAPEQEAGGGGPVVIRLSLQAAVWLEEFMDVVNDGRVLPKDNERALLAAGWMEEIEAACHRAVEPFRGGASR